MEVRRPEKRQRPPSRCGPRRGRESAPPAGAAPWGRPSAPLPPPTLGPSLPELLPAAIRPCPADPYPRTHPPRCELSPGATRPAPLPGCPAQARPSAPASPQCRPGIPLRGVYVPTPLRVLRIHASAVLTLPRPPPFLRGHAPSRLTYTRPSAVSTWTRPYTPASSLAGSPSPRPAGS